MVEYIFKLNVAVLRFIYSKAGWFALSELFIRHRKRKKAIPGTNDRHNMDSFYEHFRIVMNFLSDAACPPGYIHRLAYV